MRPAGRWALLSKNPAGHRSKKGRIEMSNAAWQSRKEQAFARGMANMLPIYVQRASNAEVWDIEGRRFLDFGSGIAVLNTGHSHPRIVAAVRDQVEAAKMRTSAARNQRSLPFWGSRTIVARVRRDTSR